MRASNTIMRGEHYFRLTMFNVCYYILICFFFHSLTEIPVPGVNNGKQFVKIADNLEKADMMQLLVYSLGMYNTFRRPDRDSFVNVMYDNIKDGRCTRFSYFFQMN